MGQGAGSRENGSPGKRDVLTGSAPDSATATRRSAPDPTASRRSAPDSATATRRTALVACGAIAAPAAESAERLRLPLDIHPLPPLLHNHPRDIPAEVERLVGELRASAYERVVVGYADCGTYGSLDATCERLGVERLPGLHCYDLYAGPTTVERLMAESPGTYLLTDFLLRGFERLVIVELGLDRHPELRDDYFRHYERMVWLVQTTDATEYAELQPLAQRAAARVGLPLHVVRTGLTGLERALLDLVRSPSARPSGG